MNALASGNGPAPETLLFRHIILHAVLDAVYGSPGGRAGEHERVRSEAVRWFADAGDDFRLICEGASLHPDFVRRKALAYIKQARDVPPQGRRPGLHPNADRKAA